jgi:hypothetical protein
VSLRNILIGGLVAAALLVGTSSEAHADAYLRVISQQAPVHTGPGAAYRQVYQAERGEVFTVLERGTRGYWFKVELEDGTTGWIFGELVFPFEVVESDDPGLFRRMGRAIRRTLLGPSPVVFSDVELSFSAGILDNEGVFIFRPAWIAEKYLAVEGFIGLTPRATLDLFMGGAGLTLRMAPGAPIGPYINASVGAIHRRPKADNFVDEQKTIMGLIAGIGIEITFKKQITLRTDVRNWSLFDPDESADGLEVSSGLAIFF